MDNKTKYINMKTNNNNEETYTRTELIIESVLIGIATGVGALVLSTAFTIFWNVGVAIWKTLIK